MVPAPGAPETEIERDKNFLTLLHTSAEEKRKLAGKTAARDGADDVGEDFEGRGVQLFDLLAGQDGNLNHLRIAHEVIDHHLGSGNKDVRPIALAITKDCVDGSGAIVVARNSKVPLAVDLGLFDARNGMSIDKLAEDTEDRMRSLPRRKADIQKLNLDRRRDPYHALFAPADGLIQQFGDDTPEGADTSMKRLRQEVFRRPIDVGSQPDDSEMKGVYADREDYESNVEKVALYRYFLEPLGVSVDRW